MFARALIVLLLVLNVGVAAWWILRPSAPPSAPATSFAGVPRLQLLHEADAPARNPLVAAAMAGTAASVAASDVAALAPVAEPRCHTFGPFKDMATLSGAQTALQSRVFRLQVRPVAASAHGWRVWLPPLADHDAAQAWATRIAGAGFKDYYIVGKGDEANSIALGRFGNEDAARRQQSALVSAGIPAKVDNVGASVNWIDVSATPAFDADATAHDLHVAQTHAIDCTTLASPVAATPR
jgi:cell division septation protein DedD